MGSSTVWLPKLGAMLTASSIVKPTELWMIWLIFMGFTSGAASVFHGDATLA